MKRYVSYLISLIFLCSLGRAAESETLSMTGTLVRAGKIEDAYKKLSEKMDELEYSLVPASFHYALGRLSLSLGKIEQAKSHFSNSNGKGSLFRSWSNFYLGSIARQENENKSAKGKLTALAGRRQPTRLRLDARKELAKTAMQRGHWREARRHLYYLERRTRGSSDYPQIIYWLVRSELKSRRKWKACRYARKLYSRYPSHSLVKHWGIDLQKAVFDEKEIGCIATSKDQRRRIDRLQLSGQAKQAADEIALLKSRAPLSGSVYVDLLEAAYFSRQGQLKEALKLLIKHYDSQKSSFAFLMQLAKVAQKSGEYHAAVGAYEMAHKKNPRSRAGRKALFQAAFTSYQFQDYDGAIRRFNRFQRKYRRSGLTRDVAWHIGWISYLRGDYQGAYKKFSWILRQKKRYRRRWRSFDKDRIQYWRAMSLLRNKEVTKAAKLFASLYGEHSISYYSLLAKGQLARLEDPAVRNIAAVKAVFEANPFNDDGLSPADPGAETEFEDDESEESLAKISDDGSESEESEDNKDNDEVEEDESFAEADFKNVRLAKHFERAKKLIEMGFDESARWELYEIEKRARKDEQLKALMYHYDLIGSYHRSSYIGEVYFRSQRHRYGINGVKYLWEYTYPKAYHGHVFEFSDEFSIPKELTWAIMRAESRYRSDAVSPVGARGLMQMMPYTAVRVADLIGTEFKHADQLSAPEYNIQFGVRYLQRLMKMFKEKVPLVAAGYNAGPHRVDRWLSQMGYLEMDEFVDHIPFIETRKYVKKVVRNFFVYQKLYGDSVAKMPWLVGDILVKARVKDFSKENWDSLD